MSPGPKIPSRPFCWPWIWWPTKPPPPCSDAGGVAAAPAKAPGPWPARKRSAAMSPRPPPTTGPSGDAGRGWSPVPRAPWLTKRKRRRGSPIRDLCRVGQCRWGGPVGAVELADGCIYDICICLWLYYAVVLKIFGVPAATIQVLPVTYPDRVYSQSYYDAK